MKEELREQNPRHSGKKKKKKESHARRLLWVLQMQLSYSVARGPCRKGEKEKLITLRETNKYTF